jgi:hypothetical protein
MEGVADWENYIKVKMWYVDYVRDPQQAQVQVIVTSQNTASRGLLYHVFFVGRDNFQGKNDTLQLIASVDNSNRKTRDELTNVITMGLMPYLALNNQQEFITFDYLNIEKLVQQSSDKWKNWVYTIQGNSDLNSNSTATIINGSGSVSAAHITDAWKERITFSLTSNNSNFETTTYAYTANTVIKNFNALFVKSLNNHWSAGLEPAFYASTYSNIKAQFSLAPGIEYNIFPYSESVNHLFTLKYRVQPLHNTYIDSTVFNVTKEFLLNEIVDATYTRIDKWGNLSLTLTASNYINRPKAYRADMNALLNFHVTKGLFFNLTGNFSVINNQLSLSKANLKPEDIVLQQKEVATSTSYGFTAGFTFTFGSIYNNIVNPRFEGGVNINPEVINVETAN